MSHIKARIIHISPYVAIVAAMALFAKATAMAYAGSRMAGVLSDYATVAVLAGVMVLVQRRILRSMTDAHELIRADIKVLDENTKALGDQIMLTSAAGAADAIHAHFGPDSLWRRNLIKETADWINDGKEITLSALEGGMRDLSNRMSTLERAWRIQRDQ